MSARRYLPLLPGLAIVLVFLVIPILIIGVISFFTFTGSDLQPILTISNYVSLFTGGVYPNTILRTMEIGFIVTLACLFLGYPLAYFMAMHVKREAFKLMFVLLLLMPWWIDYSIRSMAWLPLLGTNGALNSILLTLGVLKVPSSDFIYNEFSAVLVMIQSYILFMVSPIFFSLAKIDPSILEGAETLGASRSQKFYHITLSMSKPGMIIGSVFVFVFSMADYATPQLIGGTLEPAGLAIVSLVGVFNWPLASALSVVLVLIVLAVVYMMLRLTDIKQLIF